MRNSSHPVTTVVLDADRVLLDFEMAFRSAAREALGREIMLAAPVWDVTQRYALHTGEAHLVWSEMEETGWTGFTPMPGAQEMVALLSEWSVEIHVVTAIHGRHHPGRMRDIQRLGLDLPERNLHCVGSPLQGATPAGCSPAGGYTSDHAPKEMIFCALDPDVVVDDDVIHINAAVRQGVALPIWVHHHDIPQEKPQWSDFQARSVHSVPVAVEVLRQYLESAGTRAERKG
ncbi:hypothetical protein JKG47_12910 [Acidithiobacillus sp. MC6.1]|nr:hypothetical protein [Acidithiobacillus sp. MC6.1]